MKTICLLSLFLFIPAFFPAQAEIVVVDFQRIFENYGELKRVDEQFRKSAQEFQETQQLEVAALQEKLATFNQLRAKAAQSEVDDEQRKQLADQATTLLEDLQRMEQNLKAERAEFRKQLEAKGNRLRRRIVDQVTGKISNMAEENGWTLVIDSSARSANGLPVVHYAASGRDVTGEVLVGLNADEPVAVEPAVSEPVTEPVGGPDE